MNTLEILKTNFPDKAELEPEQLEQIANQINQINPIQDKINQLYKLTNKFPFIEYYPHSKYDEYKILNEYTNYLEDKLVLCPVTDGFEKALDLAIEGISRKKKEFTQDIEEGLKDLEEKLKGC